MPTTTQDNILRFEQYLDDTSELSSSEELNLAQKVYDDICNATEWEILKKTASGTLSTTLPYVTLPTDFNHICSNAEHTDNTISYQGNSAPKVVFVGTNNQQYRLINWSDRRQYENSDGYCYVDIVNGRLYFTKQPSSSQSYSFDYIYVPTALTLTTSIIFPERFNSLIYHGMAVDGYIIQQFDKAKSYAKENQIKYDNKLEEMKLWNASLRNE